MQALIVLSVLGCSYALPLVQDTPEVVAERARFNQLWKAQAAAAAAAPDPVSHAATAHVQAHHHAQPAHVAPHTTRWTGPMAATVPAGVQGALSQVGHTADVAAERNAFFNAYKAQVALTSGTPVASPVMHSNAISAPPAKWTGPVAATVPAGVNGKLQQVAETADVSAARNAFIASYNAALARAAPAAVTHQFTPSVASAPAPAQPRWTGPMAATVPAGVQGSVSQVGQTADVAAATAAFQQAYSAAIAATTGRRF